MVLRFIKITLLLFFLGCYSANAQFLIPLLFGDKLNSPHLGFGFETGLNYSNINGIDDKNKGHFHIGIYFDIDINKNPDWVFKTGIIGKSTMGGQSMAVYDLGDDELNSLFEGGSVKRRLNYLSVPLAVKHQFVRKTYLGLGSMVSLNLGAKDIFSQQFVEEEDLIHKVDVSDQISTFDAGLLFTFNHRLRENNPMSLYFYYYLGLVNINKLEDQSKQYNRGLYLGVNIPLGIKEEKEVEEN